MASESLGAVVLDALDQNSKTGKSLVGAYRVGGTRLIEKTLPGRLGHRGARIANFLIRGIDKVSDNTELVLDIVHDQTAKAVAMVTSKVDGVENAYAIRYLDLVGKISLPGAKIARGLSTRLAAGADGISGRAGLTDGAKPGHMAAPAKAASARASVEASPAKAAAKSAASGLRRGVKRGRKIVAR